MPDRDDSEEYRRRVIQSWLAIAAMLITAVITVVEVAMGNFSTVIQSVIVISAMGSILIFERLRFSSLVLGNLILFICYASIFFTMYHMGGLHGVLGIYMVLVPALAMLITNTRFTIIWALICSVTFGFLFSLHLDGAIPLPDINVEYHVNSVSNYLSAIILVSCLFIFAERSRVSAKRQTEAEKMRSDLLLLNILPEETAQELKDNGKTKAKYYENVTVMFTDFKGFTEISQQLKPEEIVELIDECFRAFDHIMAVYGIEKIKTIGDAYMAAGGIPTTNETHATDVVNAALEIRDFIVAWGEEKLAAGKPHFQIRIGIHTGPLVAGIVGVKKFQYDIWGDTVNTASRLESGGEVGTINISASTYEVIKDKYVCEHRGKIVAKGKGEIDMYTLVGKKNAELDLEG